MNFPVVLQKLLVGDGAENRAVAPVLPESVKTTAWVFGPVGSLIEILVVDKQCIGVSQKLGNPKKKTARFIGTPMILSRTG